MAWVMKSTRTVEGFSITIGAIVVAKIVLHGIGRPVTLRWNNLGGVVYEELQDISAAFKKIHELLNSPPSIEV